MEEEYMPPRRGVVGSSSIGMVLISANWNLGECGHHHFLQLLVEITSY
jgi:hypothetical protein